MLLGQFYVIVNVAVGGINGFFSDDANYGVTKPWNNCSPHAARDFWNARSQWEPTWNGDKTALVIDYIEMRHWS